MLTHSAGLHFLGLMLEDERPRRGELVYEIILTDVEADRLDRKSTRLNSSHLVISYAVFCLKKKKKTNTLALPHGHTNDETRITNDESITNLDSYKTTAHCCLLTRAILACVGHLSYS